MKFRIWWTKTKKIKWNKIKYKQRIWKWRRILLELQICKLMLDVRTIFLLFHTFQFCNAMLFNGDFDLHQLGHNMNTLKKKFSPIEKKKYESTAHGDFFRFYSTKKKFIQCGQFNRITKESNSDWPKKRSEKKIRECKYSWNWNVIQFRVNTKTKKKPWRGIITKYKSVQFTWKSPWSTIKIRKKSRKKKIHPDKVQNPLVHTYSTQNILWNGNNAQEFGHRPIQIFKCE